MAHLAPHQIDQTDQVIKWFDKNFIHYREYRVIICRTCRYAVIPKQIETHLHHAHSWQVTPKQRRIIREYLFHRVDIAHQSANVQYPSPNHESIPELPIHFNCYRCTWEDEWGEQCQVCYQSIKNMQKHCKDAHGWQNTQQRGGNMRKMAKQTPNRMWIDGQTCQQFFNQGGWQKLFPVQNTRNRQPPKPITVEQALQRLDKKLKWAEKEREEITIEANKNRYIPNPWLDRAGWAKHLDGVVESQIEIWIALL